MSEFLNVLPILILSGGLCIVSANCYWLCKLITKLSWRVHELEMAAKYPATYGYGKKDHYQRIKDDTAAAIQIASEMNTQREANKRLWSGEE